MKKAMSKDKKLSEAELIARFVEVNFYPDPSDCIVAAGEKRQGQRGTAIASIGVKHSRSYAVVMQMANGKLDSFSPMQLLPAS